MVANTGLIVGVFGIVTREKQCGLSPGEGQHRGRRFCAIVFCRMPTMSPVFAEHAAALVDLCRRHGVQRLELFGSAATGRDDPAHSDLDFLVEFEPIPDGRYADAYFDVLEGLEVMFRRPVDLVVASAIRNRYFRESVDRTKTLLYAA